MASQEVTLKINIQNGGTEAEMRKVVDQVTQGLGKILTTSNQQSSLLSGKFKSEFSSIETAAKDAFSGIGDHLNLFVGERIPLVGGAFLRVTENLRSLGGDAKKSEAELAHLASTIDKLASTTGKSSTEVAKFLGNFVQLENQAARDAAAIETFGAANAEKLIPELEKAGEEFANVAANAEVASSSILSLAGPIGIAVVALGAMVAAEAAVVAGIFELAKSTAEFRGHLFDTSQQLGISVETLSAFDLLAKNTGSDLAQITAPLGIFQKHLEDAQDPTSKEAALLKQLGVDATDTEGALRQTLSALARMPEGFHQTAIALDLFGRGGKSVLAILKETRGDLDGAIEKFREMGLIVSGESAKAADEFHDQLNLLDAQFRELKDTIGQEVIPIVLDALRNLSTVLRDNREAIHILGVAVEIVAHVLGDQFVTSLKEVQAIIDIVKPPLIAIAEVYERIASALGFISAHPFSPLGAESAPTTGITPAPAENVAIIDLKKEQEGQRALASGLAAEAEEAKKAAERKIKIAQEAFAAGQTTREQELDSVRDGIRQRRDAELLGLAQERNQRLTEAALAQDDIKKRQTINDQIVAIDAKARAATQKARDDIQDAETKAHKAERDELVKHEEAKLKISAELDKANIARINAAVQAGTRAALDGEKEIESIEQAALDREAHNLTARLALEPANQQAITDRLKEIEAERKVLDEEQKARRIKIAQDTADQELAIEKRADALREVQRESELGRRNDALSRGEITEVQALNMQIEQFTAAHNERLALIDKELKAETTSAERKKDLLNERAIEEEKYTVKYKKLTEERIEAIGQEAAASAKLPTPSPLPPTKIPVGRIGTVPPLTTGERVDLATGITSGVGKATDAFAGLGQAISGTLGLSQQAGEIIGGTLTNAFSSLAQAAGQAVQSFVLFGKVEGGFKKFAAELIASLAASATVQAIYQLAQGLAWLALFHFFPNPKYAEAASLAFASAAVFGSIAGAAILAGRAVAGNSFSQPSAGGVSGAGGGSAGSSPTRAQQPQVINLPRPIIQVVMQGDAAQFNYRIVDVIQKDYKNNGKTRKTIKADQT